MASVITLFAFRFALPLTTKLLNGLHNFVAVWSRWALGYGRIKPLAGCPFPRQGPKHGRLVYAFPRLVRTYDLAVPATTAKLKGN